MVGEGGDSTASPRRRLSMMGRHPGCVVLALLFVLLLPLGVAAQPLSTADLADTWRVTYLAVPTGPFTASALRAYKGDVTFDASGVASGTLITDEFSRRRAHVHGHRQPRAVRPGRRHRDPHAHGLRRALAGGRGSAHARQPAHDRRRRHAATGRGPPIPASSRSCGSPIRPSPGSTTWPRHGTTTRSRRATRLEGGDAELDRRARSTSTSDGCTVATLFFADGTIRAQRNPNDPTSFG